MPHYTPDRRYIVMEGARGPRLWRASDPGLGEAERQRHVADLMDARRALRGLENAEQVRAAREQVDRAKVALGERGPVWWDDGAPDLNRRLVKNTPYADWWSAFIAQKSD